MQDTRARRPHLSAPERPAQLLRLLQQPLIIQRLKILNNRIQFHLSTFSYLLSLRDSSCLHFLKSDYITGNAGEGK
jgi:hypothetical protein